MDCAELTAKLVSWIRDRVTAAGADGLVFGMSGGIDSSVMAVLCKMALNDRILGLIMPIESHPDDEVYARMVIDKFAIPSRRVALDGVFNAFLKVLPKLSDDAKVNQIAMANLKPRLRMTTLYYFANELKYLVAGTGDRSEITAGYFTKFGDGGVDIVPLANLVKSQVRELGTHLGIPKVIVDKPPTPGLWPGQTGEGELGVSYEELDRFILTGRATDTVKQRIESLHARSEHKRQMPVAPDFQV
ncbi:MAG: NAD(+) synthase [Chloroflexota bacterium]